MVFFFFFFFNPFSVVFVGFGKGTRLDIGSSAILTQTPRRLFKS